VFILKKCEEQLFFFCFRGMVFIYFWVAQ